MSELHLKPARCEDCRFYRTGQQTGKLVGWCLFFCLLDPADTSVKCETGIRKDDED